MLAQTNKGDVMKLSKSQEEYLKTIYLLECENNKVRVTDIAEKLGITKPSVNKGIKVLKDLELVNYKAYGDITLTEEAINIAKYIIKRQDLMEMFLIGFLNVEENRAIEDAKLIKSTISTETEEKLHKYINDLLNFNNIGCKCNYGEGKKECDSCLNSQIRDKIKSKKNWKEILECEGN